MTFEVNIGKTVEIENSHGKRTYRITRIGAWGMAELRIVKLEKTKIGRLRFPETLMILIKQ